MDMPNFKDIIQKLSVFKNNVSLLVSVIIVLVSVILFVPTQLMSGKLKEQIDQQSLTKAREVERWEGKPISRNQWTEAEKRQKEYANDANEIANLAKQSTQRELLSYEIFPAPRDVSTLIFKRFGQRYRESVDKLIIRVNGHDRPSDAELERGLEDSSGVRRSSGRLSSMEAMGPMGPMGPSMGSPTRPTVRSPRNPLMSPYGGMYGMMGEVRRTIMDEICTERAKSCSVYVNPVDLAGYEFWVDYKLAVDPNKAIEDCWYYQLGYWVIEDIFDTIDAMNSVYDSVLTAPVKRLSHVSFTMGLKRPGAASGVFTGRSRRRSSRTKRDEADRPAYVFSMDDGLTESCTGRFTNDDIDVVHFNVTVVVDTKAILPFMQQLCSAKQHVIRDAGSLGDPNRKPQDAGLSKHNQITILETKIRSIDQIEQESIAHRFYRYGKDIVVELDLICEYIFNKEGYDEIKPESAKKVPEVTDTRSRRY